MCSIKGVEELAVDSVLSEREAEVVRVFVQGAQLLGLPKSYGEIYGLLYISPEPLSMEQIRQRLNLSIGSASQGLKQLRAFKAVKTVYRAGERRDYFEAEAEFRRLATGFMREEVFPHLEDASERLTELNKQADGKDDEHAAFLEQRIDKLRNWHKLSRKLFGHLTTLIDF